MKNRRKLIAGNWKMFQTPTQASQLTQRIQEQLATQAPNWHSKCDVLLCPPYLSLERVGSFLKGTKIDLGAQDVHWEEQSARTGKISADMLSDINVTYVIIGHSEQRTFFQENNTNINRKIQSAILHGLKPIVCIGETLEEYNLKKTETVLETQVQEAFAKVPLINFNKCVLAYEPVWAIGTGQSATAQQAKESHAFIRQLCKSMYGVEAAESIGILYGGSLKATNATELLTIPDVDGGLIGGASLKAEEFVKIIKSV